MSHGSNSIGDLAADKCYEEFELRMTELPLPRWNTRSIIVFVRTEMTLKMRPGLPPFIRDENGHIAMSDETGNWLVIVTRETLERVAKPPEASLDRLNHYVDTFAAVATYKLEHGRAGVEDTIWVQREDLVEYQPAVSTASPHRLPPGL